jgi:hypothetical protein
VTIEIFGASEEQARGRAKEIVRKMPSISEVHSTEILKPTS